MARHSGLIVVRAALTAALLVASIAEISAQDGLYNVELSRMEFYRLLDAKEQDLVRSLSYNTDGSVNRGTKEYQKAFKEFSDYEKQLRKDYMSRRGRDDALVNVFEDAGFDPDQRSRLFSDSGTAPGERLGGPQGRNTIDRAPITSQDTQTPHRDVKPGDSSSVPPSAIDRGEKDFYRGELGDRDITAKSADDVSRIKQTAEAKGYTVIDSGDGYIHIKELDTIVWHEDSDAYRQYLKDKDAFKSRLANPEYIAGGKDAGAIQQVSKVQNQFKAGQPPGSRVPSDQLSLERAKYAQNLGKAGHKIDSTIVQRGQPTVTTTETRDKFRKLAQGQDQRVVLGTFGEKDPAHVDRVLSKLRDEDVVQTLKDSIDADHESRVNQKKYLHDRNRELAEGIAEATENGNVMDQRLREAELADNTRRIAELDDIDRVEQMTKDVLVEKNPQIRRKIFDIEDPVHPRHGGPAGVDPDVPRPDADSSHVARPPDADPGTTGSRPTEKPRTRLSKAKSLVAEYGADAFGAAMSLYNRYTEESERATREGKPVSQARVTLLVAADLANITDVYEGLTGLADETTTGTSDYIKDQLKYYERAGVDASKFSFRAALALKASVRGTILGTWQGCKALPGVNTGIGAAEGIYAIGSAGSDAAREQEHTALVEEFNRITQSDNRDAALASAKQMATRIRTLHASHQKFDGALRAIDAELTGMLEKLQPVSEPLKQREEYVWNIVEAARKLHAEGNFSHAALFDRLDASVLRFNTIAKLADEARSSVESGKAEMSSTKAVYEGLVRDFEIENARHGDTVTAAQGVMRLGEGLAETGSIAGLLDSLRNDMTVINQADSAAVDMLLSYRDALKYLRQVQPPLFQAQASLDRGLKFFRNEAIRKDDSGMAQQLASLQAVLEDTQIDPGRLDYYSSRVDSLVSEVTRIGQITRDMNVPPESGFEKFDLYAELASEAATPLQQSIASTSQAREGAVEALKRLRESLLTTPIPVPDTSKPTAPPPGSYVVATAINRRDKRNLTIEEVQEDMTNGPFGDDGNVGIAFNNRTGEATGDLHYEKLAVMGRTESGSLVWACAYVTLEGRGRVDVKTGRFELSLQPNKYSGLGPVTTSPNERPRGIGIVQHVNGDESWGFGSVWGETVRRSTAVKAVGIDPKNVTARVTGQIDMARGGGTARIQLGSLPEETWTTAPIGSVVLRWPVHPSSYESLRKYRVTFFSLTLWPTSREASDAARKGGLSDSLTVLERNYDFRPDPRRIRLRVGRVIIATETLYPLRDLKPAAEVIFAPFVTGLREMGLDDE
ncbi:MAG: hypothetical protein HQ518_23535 [Rhodopirellula sp.]|nr:hypothetical protein [Rhodopirellula sp.]